MIIYQMLPRLWGKGKFSSVDGRTLEYLKDLGTSHLWLTGVPRHATGEDFVKGTAGSPYAIADYYDVNPYMADDPDNRMAEFEALVERVHGSGLKLIIDFVPNHVAKNYDSAALPLYDYCDYDWTDTCKINYGIEGSWDKMLDIILFWAGKGVDGFRCDMVEMVSPDFMKWLLENAKKQFPQLIFIAEVYHKESYRHYVQYVGFDYLYDKSGLYDILRNIVVKNVTDPKGWTELWQSTKNITWNWQSLGDIQAHMLNFLENHDEQRFASIDFGKSSENEFAPLAVSMLFNKAPFLIYFGQEIGVDASESDNGRTTIFDFAHIDAIDRLNEYVHNSDVLTTEETVFLDRFKRFSKMAAGPLKTDGMVYDLCYCNVGSAGFDPDRHFVFLRHYGEETVLFYCNFSAFAVEAKINIPQHAFDIFGLPDSSGNCLTVSVAPYDCSTINLEQH